ncbi:YneK [Bacillus freudenreichii]|nr:YneK [Bacillus freudenreichii]
MLDGWFLLFILFWVVVLITLMGIGGFFMFRKFLKRLPKQDGKSDMDWEEYFVEKTKDLWTDEQNKLLDELVSPVPELFRDVARHKIAGKIGEVALEKKAKRLDLDIIIKGYIMATPKRDHKFLRKKMDELNIDLAPYEHLF